MAGLHFVFAHGKRVCTFESEDVANFVLLLNGLRKLNGTDSTEAREKISYEVQFLRDCPINIVVSYWEIIFYSESMYEYH